MNTDSETASEIKYMVNTVPDKNNGDDYGFIKI